MDEFTQLAQAGARSYNTGLTAPLTLDALLEAESRGILSPDKQALLEEARRRGLVPSAYPAPNRDSDESLAERRRELRRRQLEARIRAADPKGGVSVNPQAMSEFKQKAGALAAGAVNGASFGLADEATGLIDGLMAAPGDGTFAEGYASGRDRVRAEQQRRKQAEPTMYTAGEVGGATLPALAAAPLATGPTAWGTFTRGITMGGAEGGLHGFGNGEGGRRRADRALNGALVGATLGGAVPAAVGTATSLRRMVTDPMGGVLNLGNTARANRSIADTVRKSGKSLDTIAQEVAEAAAQGQPEFRAMDAMGITGQRRASGLARGGGDAGDEIAEYLAQRQLDQGDRVAGFVDEGFGLNGSSAAKTRDSLTQSRSATANQAYAAARGNSAPVDVRDAVGIIDARIGGMQGVDIAGDSIDGRLQSFRRRLAANNTPDGVDSIELSNFDRVLGVKQDVQDAIGAAVRAGRGNEARELGKLADALDSALEGASDGYRAANDGFREASRVIDAVDQGADMMRPGRRAIDTTSEFGAMTPDQQNAARIGYGDRALAQIEANRAPTSNKARPFQSTKAQTEADAMAIDPRLFRDRMNRETTMWETQNKALGGSRTADNLEDMNNAGQIAQQATGIGGSLATGNVGHAIANTVQAIAPRLTGQNEATRLLMARALMSQDPRQAMGRAVQTQGTELLRRRMLEAMLRNAGRMKATEGY
jgi:hypothetical protein